MEYYELFSGSGLISCDLSRYVQQFFFQLTYEYTAYE